MSNIVSLGIDLAKNDIALHGVDAAGKPMLVRPNVARSALVEVVANLPPCLIGMEACSGAHHWARVFAQHGHTVRLMAPKFVAPYRLSGKRGKNDDPRRTFGPGGRTHGPKTRPAAGSHPAMGVGVGRAQRSQQGSGGAGQQDRAPAVGGRAPRYEL